MLEQWLNEHREHLLAFTARLVATPSPNPPGDERGVVEIIGAEMKSLGLNGWQIAAKQAHRPNLIYRLQGRRPGPTLMLCGHSDTKPIGDESKWLTNPLDPVIRDGKMYGLGTTDMKAAVAAMVYATAALKQCRAELAGDLLLVINADEERGMTYGSEYLSNEYGLKADVALLGEPSGIDGPEFEFLHLLSRGMTCFKVRVRGTQMHSSLSDRVPSQNAIIKAAQALQWMNEKLDLTYRPHPLCAAPTVNLGVKIEGGVGYGVYPGVAEFQCEVRLLPDMTRAQFETDIETCLDALRKHDPSMEVSFEFEPPPLDWRAATQVPAEHPLVDILLDAAEQVLGHRPCLSAFPGGTDAMNFQPAAGIPTIPSFGPGWLPLAHGPNECVGIDAIGQAASIYAIAAADFLCAEAKTA